MGFDLGGLLQQYLGGNQNAHPDQVSDDFRRVAQAAPADAVGSGVAEAFRSDQTPPFSEMVGQLFGNGNSQQRAGMLNELISNLSPALLASLGGGLGGLLSRNSGASPTITPEQASQIAPEDVKELAARAEQQDSGIFDKMGAFYAAHPTLVHTVGSAALAIIMRNIAQRNRS